MFLQQQAKHHQELMTIISHRLENILNLHSLKKAL